MRSIDSLYRIATIEYTYLSRKKWKDIFHSIVAVTMRETPHVFRRLAGLVLKQGFRVQVCASPYTLT